MLKLCLAYHSETGGSTDVNVAYIHDRIPVFLPPDQILPEFRSAYPSIPTGRTSSLAQHFSAIWRREFPEAEATADILDDLDATTRHLLSERERSEGAFWSTSVAPMVLLDPIVHRLLRLRCRNDELQTPFMAMQESFRVAALLFLGRLRRWDSEDVLMSILTAKHLLRLQQSLQSTDTFEWGEMWPLRLWALIMGAMETGKDTLERVWYVRAIMEMRMSHALTSSGQVERMVKDILWVDEVFQERALIIWHILRSYSQEMDRSC